MLQCCHIFSIFIVLQHIWNTAVYLLDEDISSSSRPCTYFCSFCACRIASHIFCILTSDEAEYYGIKQWYRKCWNRSPGRDHFLTLDILDGYFLSWAMITALREPRLTTWSFKSSVSKISAHSILPSRAFASFTSSALLDIKRSLFIPARKSEYE